jgi:hypothetical protein
MYYPLHVVQLLINRAKYQRNYLIKEKRIMTQYHVYTEAEGNLKAVTTGHLDSAREIDKYIAFLTGVQSNEVNWYGCNAESEAEAIELFNESVGEFKYSADEMRVLHATAANLQSQLNQVREQQQ